MSKGFGTPASVPASATIKKLKRSLINQFESLEDPRIRQPEHFCPSPSWRLFLVPMTWWQLKPDVCHWVLQVVLRPEQTKGFVLFKKRWVVERTFGWFVCRYEIHGLGFQILCSHDMYWAVIHFFKQKITGIKDDHRDTLQ